jgi:iron complex outermembrane recepter protein
MILSPRLAGGLVLAASSALLSAQEASTSRPLSLPTQVVLGSQDAARDLRLPIARDQISGERLQPQTLGANLSEPLQRLPGIVALNRENYAQDLQVSSRGFGARAQFGVRGVRLIQDGIPLTMPDGQGQPALFDLDGLGRIEVLRGPLSALYGNASGGIVQGFTAEAPFHPTLDTRLATGPDGLRRSRLRYGGQHGNLNIHANIARLETDGYRDHSDTRRDTANLRLGWDIDDASTLTLLVNSLDQPDTQDPLGLTAAQVRQDRRQAVAAARTFDTRKSVRHNQAGLNYQRRLSNDDRLTLMVYGGERDVQQFLAFPGSGPFAGGGVIELDRRFGGGEIGWQRDTQAFGLPVELAAGLTYDYQGEDRLGFVNQQGNKAGLQRDEFNRVDSQDLYFISTWTLAPQWTMTAGLRHSQVEFESDDNYFADGSDDSGKVLFERTNPALGLSYQWTPALSLYAAVGRGFETPTAQELAYRPDGAGVNFALSPARSLNSEIGLKLRERDTSFSAALFHTRVNDEIVTGPNQALTGRQTFANAARSTRRGLELALDQRLGHGFNAYAAYTYLQARFDRYADGANDLSGNRLPGVPRHSLFAELAWQPENSGFSTALEAQGLSKRYANDRNQESAAGYAVFNWRAAYRHQLGGLQLEPFVRVDNLGDRQYIGSLIVNGPGGRFYEPAPERQWLAGIGLQYQWR